MGHKRDSIWDRRDINIFYIVNDDTNTDMHISELRFSKNINKAIFN